MQRLEFLPCVQKLPVLQALSRRRRNVQRLPLKEIRMNRCISALWVLVALAALTADVSSFSRQVQRESSLAAISIIHLGSEPGRRRAREQVIEDVTRDWKRQSTAALRLIVLDCDESGRAYKSELRQLFLRGVKHLPSEFQAREAYLIEPKGVRRVQYLGRTTHSNFKFALFRELEDDEWY